MSDAYTLDELRAQLNELRDENAALTDLLCLADQTIMDLNGCFPLDRNTPRKESFYQACKAIRNQTEDDYSIRTERATRAYIKHVDKPVSG